jgi:hypothetical protein
MSKLEWVELETLSTELAHLQSRIEAARSARNYGKVRLLDREMAEVSERRSRVLAEITNGLTDGPPSGHQPTTILAKEAESTGANPKKQSAPNVEAPAQPVRLHQLRRYEPIQQEIPPCGIS